MGDPWDPKEHIKQLLHENVQLQTENAELIQKVQDLIAELASIKSAERSMSISVSSPSSDELTKVLDLIKERNRKKYNAMKQKHSSELQALQQKYYLVKEHLKTLNSQLENLENTNSSNKVKAENAQTDLTSALRENEMLRKHLEIARSETRELTDGLKREIDETKSIQTQHVNEIEQLKAKLKEQETSMNSDKRDFDMQIMKIQSEKSSLETELREARKALEKLFVENERNKSVIERARDTEAEYALEREEMTLQLSQLEKKLKELASENSNMKQTNSNLRKQGKEIDEKYSEVLREKTSCEREIESLKSELERSELSKQREVANLQNQINECKRANERNEAEKDRTIAQMKVNIETSADESKSQLKKIKELQFELKKAKDSGEMKIQELTRQNESIQSDLMKTQSNLKQKDALLAAAETERSEMKKEIMNLHDDLEQKSEELETLRETVTNLDNENLEIVSNMRATEKELSDKLSKCESEARKEADENGYLKDEIISLSNRVRQLETTNEMNQTDLKKNRDEIALLQKELNKEQNNNILSLSEKTELTTQNRKLRSEISQLQSDKNILTLEVNDVRRKLEDLSKEHEESSAKFAEVVPSLEARISTLRDNAATEAAEKKSTEARCRALQSELMECRSEVDQMKQRNLEQSRQIKDAIAAKDHTLTENQEMKAQIDKYTADLRNMATKCDDLRNESTKLQSKCSAQNKEIINLSGTISDLKNTANALKAQLSEKTREANQNMTEITKLEGSLTNASAQIKAKDREIQLQQQQTQLAEAKLKEATRKNKDLLEKSSDDAMKLAELTNKLRTNESQISALMNENTSLKKNANTEILDLRQKLTDMEHVSATKHEEQAQLQKQLDTEKQANVQLRKQIETMSKQNEATHNALEEQKQANTLLQRQIEEDLVTVKQISDQNNNLNRQIADFTEKASDITSIMKQLRVSLNPDATFEEADDDSDLDFTARLAKELATLREIFFSSYKDVEKMIQERSHLQKQVEELQCQIRVFTNENGALETAVTSLREENRSLHHANDTFNKERENLSEGLMKMRDSLKMMKDKLQESEREKKELKDKVIELEIQLQTLNL